MSIACAFLGDSDLIILDQPTMGIDIVVQQEVERIIINEKRINKNLSIIISTCQSDFKFLQIVSRVWILENKELVFNESVQNI